MLPGRVVKKTVKRNQNWNNWTYLIFKSLHVQTRLIPCLRLLLGKAHNKRLSEESNDFYFYLLWASEFSFDWLDFKKVKYIKDTSLEGLLFPSRSEYCLSGLEDSRSGNAVTFRT